MYSDQWYLSRNKIIMINIDQPLRKYMLAILRSIKDRLHDGRGVETDSGKLRRSLRMKQSGNQGFIYGMNYARYLRTDRDKQSRRRRSTSTQWGFMEESIEKVPQRDVDKFINGVADALLKDI